MGVDDHLSTPLLPRGDSGADSTTTAFATAQPPPRLDPTVAAARRAVLAAAKVERRVSTMKRLSRGDSLRLSPGQKRSLLLRLSTTMSGGADDDNGNDNKAATARRTRAQRIYSFASSSGRRSTVSESTMMTDDGDEDDDEEEGDKEDEDEAVAPREKMSVAEKTKSGIVLAVTSAGIASWLIAFAASTAFTAAASASVVYATLGAAGGACILTVPMVLISEGRLALMSSLRKGVNDLRKEADRSHLIVDSLRLEVQDMSEESEAVRRTNVRLTKIVQEENTENIDELVELVQENQRLLHKMKENLRKVVLQEVVRIVIKSDLDRDNIISKKEADFLVQRLSYSLEIYGIDFDVDKFHKAVGLSPSLCGVMAICRRLLRDETGKRLSSFYDDDEEDSDTDSEDDPYDMFRMRS